MNRKGINYDVGIEFFEEYMSRPSFDPKVVHREIEIIKSDLHCNAIRISGTDIDRLMVAAEDALKQGLEVWLSPHLHDKTPDETLAYIVRCAERAEVLRKQWPNLVLIVGCELTWFMDGILKGDSFEERLGSPLAVLIKLKWLGLHNKPLNIFLSKLTKAVRMVFNGQITYASAPLEKIDWSLFDFVGLDYYRSAQNRDSYGERLKRHFTHDKPVVITEVGLCGYQGAENKGARGFMIVDGSNPERLKLNAEYVRDEAMQARELIDMLKIIETSGAEGAFAFTFVTPALAYNDDPKFDIDMAGYGIVKSYTGGKHGKTYPDMFWEPKAAFKALAKYYAE